jgi:hypothetical protein
VFRSVQLVSRSHHWLESFSIFYTAPAVQSLERDPPLGLFGRFLAHERSDAANANETGRDIASNWRRPNYESGGQEFESLRARQKPNKHQNNLHASKGAMQNKIICMASAWPSGARSACANGYCLDAIFRSELTGAAGTRRALQPSTLSECGKISSRRGIPSTRAIACAKLQSDLLVAIRNL